MKSTTHLGVRLAVTQHRRFREVAGKSGKTPSAIIREFVETFNRRPDILERIPRLIRPTNDKNGAKVSEASAVSVEHSIV